MSEPITDPNQHDLTTATTEADNLEVQEFIEKVSIISEQTESNVVTKEADHLEETGGKMIVVGQKMEEEGQKLISTGRQLGQEGSNLTKLGRKEEDQGVKMTTEGHKLVEKAEAEKLSPNKGKQVILSLANSLKNLVTGGGHHHPDHPEETKETRGHELADNGVKLASGGQQLQGEGAQMTRLGQQLEDEGAVLTQGGHKMEKEGTILTKHGQEMKEQVGQ